MPCLTRAGPHRRFPDQTAALARFRTCVAARRQEEIGIRDLTTDPAFFALLTGSFRRLLGRALVPVSADAAWLYAEAPFAVLAHDGAQDPRFVYANRAAQACFEYSLAEIVGLPSRLSAEAGDRAAREALLAAVARDGFVTGYSGLRIAKSGRRFRIAETVIWQLIDEAGIDRGQAAMFPVPQGCGDPSARPPN